MSHTIFSTIKILDLQDTKYFLIIFFISYQVSIYTLDVSLKFSKMYCLSLWEFNQFLLKPLSKFEEQTYNSCIGW